MGNSFGVNSLPPCLEWLKTKTTDDKSNGLCFVNGDKTKDPICIKNKYIQDGILYNIIFGLIVFMILLGIIALVALKQSTTKKILSSIGILGAVGAAVFVYLVSHSKVIEEECKTRENTSTINYKGCYEFLTNHTPCLTSEGKFDEATQYNTYWGSFSIIVVVALILIVMYGYFGFKSSEAVVTSI